MSFKNNNRSFSNIVEPSLVVLQANLDLKFHKKSHIATIGSQKQSNILNGNNSNASLKSTILSCSSRNLDLKQHNKLEQK